MWLATNYRYRRVQKYVQQCHPGLHTITVILTHITEQPQIIGHFFSNYYWPGLRHNLAISSMTRKAYNSIYCRQLHMDPHVLFKFGTHTCDSSDKRLVITLSVRVLQNQTLFLWVNFLVAMASEHLPSSSVEVVHLSASLWPHSERYAFHQVSLPLTQT